MDKVERIIEHAEKSCKASGARLTDKRKQVLSELARSEKALSAYELTEVYQHQFGKSIPAMTVYRILEFLENESLVHKLHLANKYVACSHITCDHTHGVPQFLICGECNKVSEVHIEKPIIESLNANIKDAGYLLVSPQLEIDCICSECNQNIN